MDIDNFEWWYSEGEAPDEEWNEPTPRDASSDEDETGNDVAADSDAALDSVEPLTFEQAWAQAEADEAKADARRASRHVDLAGKDPAAASQHRSRQHGILQHSRRALAGRSGARAHTSPQSVSRGRCRTSLSAWPHPYRLHGRRYRMLGNWKRLEPC